MGLLTPISSSLLKFRVDFDVYNNTLTITDIFPSYSSYGGVYADIFSIQDPDGIIFYQNAGWATNDFSSPDLSNSIASKVLSGSGFPLDLVTNFVKLGVYTFTMKNTADGGTTYSTINKTLNVDYVRPSPLITMTANILASTLLIEDGTSYNVLHSGVSITPAKTYLQTLVAPIDPITGSPVVANVTSTALTFSVGPDIYTGTYINNLATTAVYSLELWDGTVWAIIRDTILGQKPETVRADTCMCQYYNCISSLQLQLDTANGVDPVIYTRLRKAKDLINDYMNMYLWAIKCGLSTVYWCNKIKDILVSTVPCDCAQDDDAPVEIIAVIPGGGGGGGTPSTFVYTFGTGTADFPISPGSGDVHEFTDTSSGKIKGDIWQYNGSAWVFEINNTGVTGAKGDPGSSNGSTVILHNSLTSNGTPAGTSNTTLKTYTLPLNTMVNNGDQLKVIASYILATNDRGKEVTLTWNGDTIAQFYTDALLNTSTKNVKLEAEINRINMINQFSLGGAKRFGGFINEPKQVLSTADLSSTVVINACGQNDEGYANDIISNQLCVMLFSMISGSILGVSAFAQGIATLVGGVPQDIAFASTFPSAGYSISFNAYDSLGNPQSVTFDKNFKVVGGFRAESLVDCTMEWVCVLQ